MCLAGNSANRATILLVTSSVGDTSARRWAIGHTMSELERDAQSYLEHCATSRFNVYEAPHMKVARDEYKVRRDTRCHFCVMVNMVVIMPREAELELFCPFQLFFEEYAGTWKIRTDLNGTPRQRCQALIDKYKVEYQIPQTASQETKSTVKIAELTYLLALDVLGGVPDTKEGWQVIMLPAARYASEVATAIHGHKSNGGPHLTKFYDQMHKGVYDYDILKEAFRRPSQWSQSRPAPSHQPPHTPVHSAPVHVQQPPQPAGHKNNKNGHRHYRPRR
jgi:hypothetical protein